MEIFKTDEGDGGGREMQGDGGISDSFQSSDFENLAKMTTNTVWSPKGK